MIDQYKDRLFINCNFFSLQAQADRRIPPVPLRRSGLPRPSSGLPRPTSSSSLPRPSSALPRLTSIASSPPRENLLTQTQPTCGRTILHKESRISYGSRLSGIVNKSQSPGPSLWPHKSNVQGASSVYAWDDDEVENVEEEIGWGSHAAAEDESSPFSRQLAKITRGSSEDVWETCRPSIQKNCSNWVSSSPRDNKTNLGESISNLRSKWHSEGAYQVMKSPESLSKNSIGRRVVIGGAEEGTLRYYGRTAFASGVWCGIELDRALGKNDGSVDGVIYFTCKTPYGLFAPENKVSLLPYDTSEVPLKRIRRTGNPSNRLSDCSTSSSNSSARTSRDEDACSIGRRSSGASSATYTIVGRGDDCSLPTSPETGNTYHIYHDMSLIEDHGEGGSSGPPSPGDATYDDSSLGILTPDQMPDFTVTASVSLERSPSDEDVAALQDEVCDEALERWDSQGSVSGVEELLQRDISVIIHELRKEAEVSSSGTSSPSRPSSLPEEDHSHEVQNSIEISNCAKKLDIKEQVSQQNKTGNLQHHQPVRPPEQQNRKRVHICQVDLDDKNNSKVDNNLEPVSISYKTSNKDKNKVRQVRGKMQMQHASQPHSEDCGVQINEEEPERESAVSWQAEGNATMTLSAASLDQGYQGDGEFDVPSEAGSATASSPIEDPQLFEGVIDIERLPLDANHATEADVSLADDEAESEAGVTPRDRTARIIDGKLYHSHRELASLRHGDGHAHGRGHDPHTSEMDSSGFYSDLDPREDESTRHDAPALQPLREANQDTDLHDSVIDDTYHDADDDDEDDDECKSDVLGTKGELILHTEEIIDQQIVEESKDVNLVKQESKELTVTTDLLGPSPAPSDITTSPPQSCSSQVTIVETNEDSKNITDIKDDISTENSKDNKEDANNEKDPAQAKPRNYNKPWLSRGPLPKKPEVVKKVLPPPPPMPKKNVQSKLKALLEAQETSTEERRPRQQKKNRWDEVMNRIAEGQKEEKNKPKVREVKSRLLESIKAPVALSPQAERIRQERRERRERRERQQAAAAAAARRSNVTRGERRRR